MAELEIITVDEEFLRSWPLPTPASRKDARGIAAVVGGSVPNPGAVLLGATAALRVGAGKVQIVTPHEIAIGLALAMPEALVAGGPSLPEGDLHPGAARLIDRHASKADALLVGPGMLSVSHAYDLMEDLASTVSCPVWILDALALSWVTEKPERVRELNGTVILSPNPQELSLTLGAGDTPLPDEDVPAGVVELATRTGAVVSSGTKGTWTADPERNVWHVQAGCPGLAVAGSGDVKAGLILGLAARGATPAQAVVWACALHGMAGDVLAERIGPTGFLSREIPGEIPGLLSRLSSPNNSTGFRTLRGEDKAE